ncbi:hypothetical protein [Rufibacter quisquiliarum]|uniref:Uncharacterized protein n=1 Tax=Rufibacter quisquiliarum TaxID=1549639 RepID=A0A839GWT9_9BACT|nr:hypothetical protein [Rufibacter quisquiliarum]MBA9078201.1 hypothetical protein [Rufibacter quisquiliarum]
MPILHRFYNYNWENGFETHRAILDTIPYEPEVIIIGTFNHGWDWNNADFFYGRGMYMWTIMANLFLNNGNALTEPRTVLNDTPNLEQIFQVCQKARITFADVVQGTRPNIPVEQQGRSILVNNEYIWEDYKDTHLKIMGRNGWLDDNADAIVDYINSTKSIKHVYFTFKPTGWLLTLKNSIADRIAPTTACSIFTPTANGFRANLPAYPHRAWSLAHCWVWNGLHHAVPINKPNFCHLDHGWLVSKGVNPNNF